MRLINEFKQRIMIEESLCAKVELLQNVLTDVGRVRDTYKKNFETEQAEWQHRERLLLEQI